MVWSSNSWPSSIQSLVFIDAEPAFLPSTYGMSFRKRMLASRLCDLSQNMHTATLPTQSSLWGQLAYGAINNSNNSSMICPSSMVNSNWMDSPMCYGCKLPVSPRGEICRPGPGYELVDVWKWQSFLSPIVIPCKSIWYRPTSSLAQAAGGVHPLAPSVMLGSFCN
jgi:hypothetical protein